MGLLAFWIWILVRQSGATVVLMVRSEVRGGCPMSL